MLSNVRSFVFLRSTEGLTTFKKNKRVNFFLVKMYYEAFRGVVSFKYAKQT